MLWLLAIILLSLTLFYFYLKNVNRYWVKRGVVQGNPLPLLGDTWGRVLRRFSFAETVQYAYNMCPGTRYTGIYRFILPALMLRDPDLIKRITVKDFDHFMDHRSFIPDDMDPLFGKNLFQLTGKKWRDIRNVLSPAFTSSKMRFMYDLIKKVADDFTDYFVTNEGSVEIEMRETFTRFTNDVIASTAFGVEVNSLKEKTNEFFVMGQYVSNFGTLSNLIKIMAYAVVPKFMKFFNITFLGAKVNDFFVKLIDDAIRIREEKKIVRPDMLHLMMEARKDSEGVEKITNHDIAAQALVFFFAGFDSVASLMSFMSYELAIHPEVQSRLREEINETFQETNGNVTYEALLKMNYLDMVINETLRKWPNFAAVDRICTKAYKIEPINPEESPVYLKEGDAIWLPMYALQRDPNHFPDPDRFDPERFNEENKKSINPYTFIPFGIGPRGCIGSRFALLETKALFFNLLRNFELSPGKKLEIPLKLSLSGIGLNAQGGFWINMKRIQ